MFLKGSILMMCLLLLYHVEGQSQSVWQRHEGNPVLPAWSGDIDDPSSYKFTYAPSVFFDSTANLYKMWFCYQAFGFGVTFNLGYAVSTDGTNWLVYAKNPVMRIGSSGSFDAVGILDPFVIKDGTGYRLYYTGYNGSVWQTGVATSPDGIKWTKYSGNPILTVRPGTWESVTSNDPKVYFTGSQYVMLYSGFNGTNYEIGLATSPDGFNWTKSPQNPILRRGPVGSWDQNSVVANALFVKNGKYYLFYGGGPGNPIGYASSTDNGNSWTKYGGNPVFFPGASGSWDNSHVEFGSLLLHGNQLKYWYSGFGYLSALGGSVWQIGYATSDFVTSSPETKTVIPNEYSLSQSYPNPFNPATKIEYSIAGNEHVTIMVFDALGRELETIVNEDKPTGSYSALWNASNYASGVYVYQITAGSFRDSKKMILMK